MVVHTFLRASFVAATFGHSADPTPPVFPTQWSGRIHEVAKQGAGIQEVGHTCHAPTPNPQPPTHIDSNEE